MVRLGSGKRWGGRRWRGALCQSWLRSQGGKGPPGAWRQGGVQSAQVATHRENACGTECSHCFKRRLGSECVVGVTDSSRELVSIVAWREGEQLGSEEADLVPWPVVTMVLSLWLFVVGLIT